MKVRWGENGLFSGCQWSFHYVVLVVTGPLLAQAKLYAGSVFTLFYTTGMGTGKFNSSFIWHNPHAVTVKVLSLAVLFGELLLHHRFLVIAIIINQPKAPTTFPPPTPQFPLKATDIIFWPALLGSNILCMCDFTGHFKNWNTSLKFTFPSHCGWQHAFSDAED